MPNKAPIYPVSRTVERFNNPGQAGRITSACSIMVYRDRLLGPELRSNMFVCEPVHNLIHREILEPKGVTFRSHRAARHRQREFLASSDNWFRPVMVRTGPDGALWIADMYRRVIEHPEWIPDNREKHLDLRAGHEKGRLYRLVPVRKGPRPIPDLAKLNSKQLVEKLRSPNGTVRDLVGRLLIRSLGHRTTSKAGFAWRTMHALCTLQGLDGLTADILQTALRDSHPAVRRHAIRLSEPLLNEHPQLAQAVTDCLDDPDPHVQMQLSYSLGEWRDPQAGRLLGRLVLKHQTNKYLRAAVLSSLNTENLAPALEVVFCGNDGRTTSKAHQQSPSEELISQMLHMTAAMGDPRTLRLALQNLISEYQTGNGLDSVQPLAVFLESWQRHREQPFNKRLARFPDSIQTGLNQLATEARKLIENDKAATSKRRRAVKLLSHWPDEKQRTRKQLQDLLDPQTPPALQSAALSAISRIAADEAMSILFSHWRSYTPKLRTEVLQLALQRESWTRELLANIKASLVSPSQINAKQRQQLLDHADQEISQRAETLLATSINADREAVLKDYRSAFKQQGDAGTGAQLFKEHCATCHRLGGVGKDIGPDLAALKDKSPEALLTAILDPNRAVEAKYTSYKAVTKDGLTHSGLLAEESAGSITLIDSQGERVRLLRKELAGLRGRRQSFMPEGLEKDLTAGQLADLIAYITHVGHSSAAGQ